MNLAARIAAALAVVFALLALFVLGLPLINELEDIRAMQLFGWPPLLLSSVLGLVAARRGYRKAFVIAGLLNVLPAVTNLLLGWEGGMGVIGLPDHEYWRQVGNKYAPLDLLTVAIFPAVVVGASWVAFLRMRNTTLHSA